MASESTAFDLTPGEKHTILDEIKTLLLQASAQIGLADMDQSKYDDVKYTDALFKVDQALMFASDPDAVDPASSPLATCHYHRGQVLLAMGRREEAYDEYKLATTAEIHTLMDRPAVRDAATRLRELEEGWWPEFSGGSGDPEADRGRQRQGTGDPGFSGVTAGDRGRVNPGRGYEMEELPRRCAEVIRGDPGASSGSARRRTVIVETDGQVTMFSPTEVRHLEPPLDEADGSS